MRFSRAVAYVAVGFLGQIAVAQAPPGRIRVSPSRAFFNPSLGEVVRLDLKVPFSGSIKAEVLDRDGVIVRSLPPVRATLRATLNWDGRDNAGNVVPDEAYSFKIDLRDKARHLTYFPAAVPSLPTRDVRVQSYDPRTGIVAYTLPFAGRVHLQAGSAVLDPQGKPEGPVLRNIVDRQPRVAGSVVEYWDGLDEGGTIVVPDQPHFVMALVASALPDNSVITVGNRSTSFLNYVAHRHDKSLVPPATARAHHVGVQTLDDIAPAMELRVVNASWVAAEKAWRVQETPTLSIRLSGPAAERFLQHSELLTVFIDGKPAKLAHPTTTATSVTLPRLAPGAHTIAVNWDSSLGPVAVNALRLTMPPSLAAR